MSKPGTPQIDRRSAEALDSDDPLRHFRTRFVEPTEDIIYLDGNSLGRPPKATAARLSTLLSREWADRLIRSWEERWLELPEKVGDAIGEAVIGAAPGQTVVADSTTVCFYKLLAAGAAGQPGRSEIVTDVGNFPTNRYVLEAVAAQQGMNVRWIEADPLLGPQLDDVERAVGEQTAVVALSHVGYHTAAIADMGAINRMAHDSGALTLWDLSHSAGSIPVELDALDTDLAVGCTYKYLNGGPGAPAYLYVNRRHQSSLRQPIWGWLGRQDPFAMAPGYEPASGITGFISGTPPIVGLAGVEEGVLLVAEAGIEALRAKGTKLTEFAIDLFDQWLAPLGFELASPRDPDRRGAHVSFVRGDAAELADELVANGVIPDFRPPAALRIGLSPLTTRFVEVFDGLATLRRISSDDR